MSAFAATNSVSIYVHDISENTDTLAATYTRAQLEDTDIFTINKYNYSAVTCDDPPAYKCYTAKGPELKEVLTKALVGSGNILSDVGDIKITSSDNYSKTIAKSILLADNRYYFEEGNDQHVYAVPAILATSYAGGADVEEGSLSSKGTLRNFYGQTYSGDYIINNFIKDIATITVYVP